MQKLKDALAMLPDGPWKSVVLAEVAQAEDTARRLKREVLRSRAQAETLRGVIRDMQDGAQAGREGRERDRTKPDAWVWGWRLGKGEGR